MRRAVVGGVCVFLVALSSAVAQQAALATGYRIGPKDLVEIRVFEEPSLNVQRRVPDSGSIDVPLLGEVPVQGLTAEELAARLEAAWEADFLQTATVGVQVREFRSRPISVIGAVKKPGNLELSGRWTLLEALTEAGGLADNHGDAIRVLRRAENGLSDQLTISLDDLLKRADPAANIPIFANDVIHVPPAREVSVFFMGEVERPGAVTFKSTDRISLVTAIARAGGLTERAAHRIVVKRTDDSGMLRELVAHFKRIMAGEEPDLLLQPGDVVVVKESFF